MDIEAIGFEGGGIKWIAYIGALKKLQEYGMDLSKIKRYAGTSSGAQIAALLAVGYDANELEAIMYNIPFQRFDDRNWGIFRNTHRILWRYGYHRGKYIKKYIDKLITNKMGNNKITFEQLYINTGVVLRITGTCLNTKTLEYFDHINSPDMSISKAVQISSCVPLKYAAVKYKDKYYVDGSLLRKLPIKAFPDNKTIFFKFAQDLYENEHPKDITNIIQFLYSIINTTSKYCNELAIKDSIENNKNIQIVEIDAYMIKNEDITVSDKTKSFLVKQGEHAVTDYVNKKYMDRVVKENILHKMILKNKSKKSMKSESVNDDELVNKMHDVTSYPRKDNLRNNQRKDTEVKKSVSSRKNKYINLWTKVVDYIGIKQEDSMDSMDPMEHVEDVEYVDSIEQMDPSDPLHQIDQ